MDKPNLVIFGARENAEVAAFYFIRDRLDLSLSCFVVDEVEVPSLLGRPVISTAEFREISNPLTHRLFAPYVDGGSRLNTQKQWESLGFSFESYISPQAIIWNPTSVGRNCFIQEFNNIQYGTRVGDSCSMWAGNHIGHHGVIGEGVTFTSHVVLSGRCTVGSGCYFGVNATIRDGLKICPRTFVGQCTNVVKDISEPGIYVGSPAVKIRDWN